MKSLTALAKKAKCKLTVCSMEESMEDQWMQVRGPVWGADPRAGPRLQVAQLAPCGHPSSDGQGARSLSQSLRKGTQARDSTDVYGGPLHAHHGHQGESHLLV